MQVTRDQYQQEDNSNFCYKSGNTYLPCESNDLLHGSMPSLRLCLL